MRLWTPCAVGMPVEQVLFVFGGAVRCVSSHKCVRLSRHESSLPQSKFHPSSVSEVGPSSLKHHCPAICPSSVSVVWTESVSSTFVHSPAYHQYHHQRCSDPQSPYCRWRVRRIVRGCCCPHPAQSVVPIARVVGLGTKLTTGLEA